MQDFLQKSFWEITWQPSFMWIGIELLIILIVIFLYKVFPKSAVFVFLEMAFEAVYNFFWDLLWNDEKTWVKTFVTILFFIIIISNLLGVIVEFLMPIIGKDELHHFIVIPTADINFNIAMAIISIGVILYEQFRHLWTWKFIHEYLPVFWKNYIPYKMGNLPKALDIIAFGMVKIFDIIISVFLWLLEIVWIFAKIVSLSFRLFWNMTAGWTLLYMLFWAMYVLTIKIVWFDFPLFLPLVVYLQEILVSFIQALVFPLLIAIFIKVAKMH